MGKIIITEQQLKLLLGEETVPYGSEIKGKALYHTMSLPTDKRETPGAIKTLLSSILDKVDSFPLGNVDLRNLDTRNKMRFSGYLDAFHGAKDDNRGHMWEGLFAGLYGGQLTLGDESEFLAPKADVKIGGTTYSLKFVNNKNQNPVLGNLGLARNASLGLLPEDLQDYGTTAPIYEIFRNEGVGDLYNFKKEILDVGFADVNFWIFAYPDPPKGRNIIFRIVGNEELKNKILKNPQLIFTPKSKGGINELRISHDIVNSFPAQYIINFPTVSEEEYEEYERLTPTETHLGGLFGKKRKERIDPDVLQNIRKNPQPFIKRLHKMYGDRFNLGLTF